MRRLYEWLRLAFQEKVNVFVRGFTGGSLVSGILLFGGQIHDTSFLVLAYLLKVFAVAMSGVISGCATVLGSDMAAWIKAKWKQQKRKRVINRNRKKKAA